MQRLESISRATLAAPRFLMSTPAGLQGYEPEQYCQKAACLRAWDSLRTTLSQLGAEIDVYNRNVQNAPAVSEVGNAAFIHDGTAFIPKEKSLRGIIRRQFMDEWAQKRGFRVKHIRCINSPRDVLRFGDIVLTQVENGPQPKDVGAPVITVTTKDVHPRLNKLDTVLCPLDSANALIVREAFDDETFALLASRMNLIEVPVNEALNYACNAIVLGGNVIVSQGCDETAAKLRFLGYVPFFVDLSMFRGGPQKFALRIA